MSKKKWLLIIIISALVGYALITYNVIPAFTDAVKTANTTVLGWFGTNPYAVAGAGASIVGAIFTTYKVVHDRAANAISSIQESAGSLNSQLNNANVGLQTRYSELDLQYQMVTGKLTATQSELETVKTTLSDAQQKLAAATTELQRKQDQINAVATIKAIESKFPVGNPTQH